jgi:hypothetical protein
MLEILGWLVILVIPPLGILWLALNAKKKLSYRGRNRVAFFHPFW